MVRPSASGSYDAAVFSVGDFRLCEILDVRWFRCHGDHRDFSFLVPRAAVLFEYLLSHQALAVTVGGGEYRYLPLDNRPAADRLGQGSDSAAPGSLCGLCIPLVVDVDRRGRQADGIHPIRSSR